ncbi:uncharacterized protein LOC113329023 [Papaver somniferum]|uniref:uncharacterized protein LOC113329023 n=1 Tax=Papaver somniferum TaxID=3469 RepID=UPI000E6FDDEE|nr:uncharacterized protein LOC113329023 [Papaver somniferum]
MALWRYSSRANLQAHELYHPVADADALNYAAAAAAAREVFLEEILTRLVYWLGNLLILDFSVFHQQALNDFSELTKEERDTISNKCILRVRRDNGYSDAINAARVCDSLKFRFESRSPAEPPGIYTNAKKYYRRLRKKALERRRKFLAEIEELRNEDSKRQRETAAKAEADITSDGESDSDSDTDYFGSDSENDTDSDTDSTESDDESNADSEPDYNQSDDESNADSEIDYSESDDESYSDSETEHIENDAESRVKTRHTQSDGESDLLSEIEYSEEMADLLGIDRHMFRDCI